MDISEGNSERNAKTLTCWIAHSVWTNLTWLDVYILDRVSLLPVSDEARRTVTGQLPVGAVASIEAGVVPRVIAAHWDRQLGPPARETRKPVTAMHCSASHLKLAATEVLEGGGVRGGVVESLTAAPSARRKRISQTGAALFSFLQLPTRETERLSRATRVIRLNISGNFSQAGCQIREEWKIQLPPLGLLFVP